MREMTAEERWARKLARDEARERRRWQRFADRLFNGAAIGYCVFLMAAIFMALGR